MLYKLFNETQNIVSEIERVTGVTLAKARKGVGAMIDYEARLKEDLAEARAEAKAEARTEAVKAIVKSWHRLGQDYAAARAYVLENYPDIDAKLLDNIVEEIYNLQETCS